MPWWKMKHDWLDSLSFKMPWNKRGWSCVPWLQMQKRRRAWLLRQFPTWRTAASACTWNSVGRGCFRKAIPKARQGSQRVWVWLGWPRVLRGQANEIIFDHHTPSNMETLAAFPYFSNTVRLSSFGSSEARLRLAAKVIGGTSVLHMGGELRAWRKPKSKQCKSDYYPLTGVYQIWLKITNASSGNRWYVPLVQLPCFGWHYACLKFPQGHPLPDLLKCIAPWKRQRWRQFLSCYNFVSRIRITLIGSRWPDLCLHVHMSVFIFAR